MKLPRKNFHGGLVALAVWVAMTTPAVVTGAEKRPNIVLIMADDVGWECLRCYGGEDYHTPRLDALASNGLKFNHCYSTPICSTTRVKLMTGKYNFRNYTHFGYLSPDEKTFGNLLQTAGYKTAIAGKWQLNGLTSRMPGHDDKTRPMKAGFDEYMLWQLTRPKAFSERYWSPALEHNGTLQTTRDNLNQYGPDLLNEFVCDFIDRNQKSPFFVYYPMVLAHDPFVPTPDTIGDASRGPERNVSRGIGRRRQKENFVAMVGYMDKLVGRVVDKLDEVGQLENTLVIFTADNGTSKKIRSQWNGREIRGGKGGLKDSGTHVPLVAMWKGMTPVGKESDRLVDFTDFYPTLAQAAGAELGAKDPIDGISFFSSLVGKPEQQREWLLCHYQPYWNQQPGQFVRDQKYKMYRDGRCYDISSGDLDEKIDLQQSLPTASVEDFLSLKKILDRVPEAPAEAGSRDTIDRPTYANWPNLFEDSIGQATD